MDWACSTTAAPALPGSCVSAAESHASMRWMCKSTMSDRPFVMVMCWDCGFEFDPQLYGLCPFADWHPENWQPTPEPKPTTISEHLAALWEERKRRREGR